MSQITGSSLAEVVGKINAGATAAIGVMAAVKAMRDMAKAMFPDAPEGTFPTDAELIGNMIAKGLLLKGDAADMRAWLEGLSAKPQHDDDDQPDSGDN